MCQIMAELTVLGKLLLIFFAVFKNQSIFYFIVQLFGIKRLNWLISSSLKKKNIYSGALKVTETLPVVVYFVHNKH